MVKRRQCFETCHEEIVVERCPESVENVVERLWRL